MQFFCQNAWGWKVCPSLGFGTCGRRLVAKSGFNRMKSSGPIKLVDRTRKDKKKLNRPIKQANSFDKHTKVTILVTIASVNKTIKKTFGIRKSQRSVYIVSIAIEDRSGLSSATVYRDDTIVKCRHFVIDRNYIIVTVTKTSCGLNR